MAIEVSTTTELIENLADWGKAVRVNTRYGPKKLRKAVPSQKFWNAWKSAKEDLKRAGVQASKNKYTGRWEALWWLPDEEREAEEREQIEKSRATDAEIDIPAPEGLDYLGYQRAGIAFATQRDSVLIADEMGLGKTIQALGVINADDSIRRSIVVCPASLRRNWAREARKWLVRPTRIEVVNGGKREVFHDPEDAEGRVLVVVNYDVLERHYEALRETQWDFLVADEAHLLKNHKTKRTLNVLGGCKRKKRKDGGYDTIKYDAIPSRKVAFLTGTPIVNRPIELWPLLSYLDPQRWNKRTFMKYAKRYCDAKHNGFGWDMKGASNLDELQRILRSSVMVRRLKDDVLTELPNKIRQVLSVPANGDSEAVNEEIRKWREHQEKIDDLLGRLEEARAAEHIEQYEALLEEYRSAMSVLFEEISKARHKTALAKVKHVVEHVENATGPVVVFAHHKDVIEQIANHFGDRAVKLTGAESTTARDDAVQRFQNGDADVFVGSIKAAGMGLTLTTSSHVVFAELDWVPGALTQAEDRVHRIGQENRVLVQHVVLAGSLDEKLVDVLIEKQQNIRTALDEKVEDGQDNAQSDPATASVILPASTGKVPETSRVSDAQIAEKAENVTYANRDAIHKALRQLSAMDPDRAAELNDVGYNKADGRIGHALASENELTAQQTVLGAILVKKYHRQVGEGIIDTCNEILRGD